MFLLIQQLAEGGFMESTALHFSVQLAARLGVQGAGKDLPWLYGIDHFRRCLCVFPPKLRTRAAEYDVQCEIIPRLFQPQQLLNALLRGGYIS